jgi:Replication initiation factor
VDTTPTGTNVLQTGVDWITATTPADGREWPLLLAADAILAQEERDGHELERARWQGYDLKCCGGAWAGAREDSALVRLSGETAGEHWYQLVRHAKRITRLDLAVTVRPEPPNPKLAAQHLRQVLRWRKGRQQSYRVNYHGTPEGIQTVYLGSRTSATYGRIYDKWAESEDDRWRDSWRYEVECKDVVATGLARALMGEPDRERPVRVYVHDWFDKHGVHCAFPRPGGDVHAPSTRAPGDDDRTLRWWDDQVAAVYARLAPKVGSRRMLSALGAGGGWHVRQSLADKWQERSDGNR